MALSSVTSSLNHAPFGSEGQTDKSAPVLADENKTLTAEIARLRLQILELERKADTDPLVPVYNRRAFIREVSRAQAVAERYGLTSSIIFFDLNGFKSINDQYGHSVGDSLLKAVGDVLLKGVRHCDMVARLGGDEFGVLLFKSSLSVAKAKAAALACRLSQEKIETTEGMVSISTAWGVASCETDQTVEKILDTADKAMYQVKSQTK